LLADAPAAADVPLIPDQYEHVSDQEALQVWIGPDLRIWLCAVGTETTGLDILVAQLVRRIRFASKPGKPAISRSSTSAWASDDLFGSDDLAEGQIPP